jgi:Methane oxygenase PmoA
MLWLKTNLLNIKPVKNQMVSPKILFFIFIFPMFASAQHPEEVRLVKIKNENRIDVFIGSALFTRFIYPDSLEKPVLFPILDAGNNYITRGFPLDPRPGEPSDHPHHIGLWLTYENVNGLDFWNNSYAIPPEKKSLYGWIKTDSILKISDGTVGTLIYHANWENQHHGILLEETTLYEFSGKNGERTIDRSTTFVADTAILFSDAKDGFLGLRVAHELQIPHSQNQQFTDNKGNITNVKSDAVSSGNYLTSEGKWGDSVWSTRAAWCKLFGKIGEDSVSITIFDQEGNPDYPTFWHARGYGLFAANPLGKKIFTNGKSELNLKLKKGDTLRFRYRILIQNGKTTPSVNYLNEAAKKYNDQFLRN